MDARVAVITGASAGVGRATAREMARAGYRLGLIARGEEGLAATRKEAQAEGARTWVERADVADDAALDAAAEAIEEQLGPIDVWINDAMVTVFAPFWDITTEEYERVTQVTYLGVVNGTRAALRRMRPRGRGRIVQVGSALSYRGIPLQSAYCGAKHAIKGFTESVRTELAHERNGVTIGMVHLPAVNTPQFELSRSRMPREAKPVPPIYQPEVAAQAIRWAAEHDRDELLVGFPTLKAVWGNRFAPWLVDRILARTGYDRQQTQEPRDRDRPDNLYRPVPGDHGAHGPFDRGARSASAHLTLTTHRRLLAAGLAAALGMGWALVRRAGR